MSARLDFALVCLALGLANIPSTAAAAPAENPGEVAVDPATTSQPEADAATVAPTNTPDAGAAEADPPPVAEPEPPPAEPVAPAPAEPAAPAESVAVAAEVVPATVDADAEPEKVATPSEDAEPKAVDRKAGDHLRPKNHDMLNGKHPIELGKTAVYKPGTGMTFESQDGRFKLATRLRAQFRYTLENEDESGDTLHGLQIRRARLQFKGHVFNKHNKFKTEFAVSPRDMGFDGSLTHRTPILDWYFDFDYLRDLTLRIGQYKVPFSRQRVVSSGDLQLVDRSIANGEFNLDRDIGIDFRSKDFLGLDKLRYYAGLYFGEGRDQYRPSNFDMFYLARVEVLPFGMFKDYKEADFQRALHPRLSLGAAYAFVDGGLGNRGTRGSTPSDGGTTDYHNVTADAMFKVAGFSFFADVFYRQGRRNFGDAVVVDDATGVEMAAARELARNGVGWSATAGFLIPRVPFELAARYSQVASTSNVSSLSRRDEVGGGASYYFAGHPLKLQLDYFAQYIDGLVLQSDHIVRLQLQAAF
ncbi:MAG: porin [Myxococcota bacterium]